MSRHHTEEMKIQTKASYNIESAYNNRAWRQESADVSFIRMNVSENRETQRSPAHHAAEHFLRFETYVATCATMQVAKDMMRHALAMVIR